MKIKKIIVIPKLSKYELDMKCLNLSEKELIEKYENEGINIKRIINSHQRQKDALNKLKELLPEAEFIQREGLTKEIVKKADLIISFGGDNHFQYVSHFLNGKLILGINSDPVSSEGVLNNFTIESFKEKLNEIKKGNYKVENWTRLKVILNNKVMGLAIDEVFIGESERKNMSRHIIKVNNNSEEQKNSGLIIATGAGSTGWYDSSCRYLFENGDKFPKDSEYAKFIATEPYRGKLNGSKLLHGILNKNETINVASLNDSGGIVSLDCLEEYEFNRGAKVKIKIGVPLKVIIVR